MSLHQIYIFLFFFNDIFKYRLVFPGRLWKEVIHMQAQHTDGDLKQDRPPENDVFIFSCRREE